MKTCPYCSRRIPDEANYCPYPHCGRPVRPLLLIWIIRRRGKLVISVIAGTVLVLAAWLTPRPAPPTAAPARPTTTPAPRRVSSTLTAGRPLPSATPLPPSPTPTPPVIRAVGVLVDDFAQTFNRLDGDRGPVNGSLLNLGQGRMTVTLPAGNSWGGVWLGLNHPRDEGEPIPLAGILPPQIAPAYQSRMIGVTVNIADGTPTDLLKLELKDRGELRWKKSIVLQGGPQVMRADLPALGDLNELLLVLDDASAGDFVVLEDVSFTAATSITDTALAAFVWSYGMLLRNWNPDTGLVRDKARDASGEFDAIQATGGLAAATAIAEQLGVVSRADALQIVDRISDTLLLDLPRYHGLWPHWVQVSPGGRIAIVPGTEWSSVDTVVAALGLLTAQSSLGLDTTGTEQVLRAVDWDDLLTPEGISHGYNDAQEPLPYAWDVFGGESWLVALAYAAATGQVMPLAYPGPPTANGSGFIDELAWLFVPPPEQDVWGADWATYRAEAADGQIAYHPTHYPASCPARLGLFGLSAAEIPDPALSQGGGYRAFGRGGRFAAANDGMAQFDAPVVVPHYAALVASLRPEAAIGMWDWLIARGLFSPLNNAESLVFAEPGCSPEGLRWNALKGSWNLSLQTLGWGRYLAQREGQFPALWRAVVVNPFLRGGYNRLFPRPSPRRTAVPGTEETLPPSSHPGTRSNYETLTSAQMSPL